MSLLLLLCAPTIVIGGLFFAMYLYQTVRGTEEWSKPKKGQTNHAKRKTHPIRNHHS